MEVDGADDFPYCGDDLLFVCEHGGRQGSGRFDAECAASSGYRGQNPL